MRHASSDSNFAKAVGNRAGIKGATIGVAEHEVIIA